MEAARFFCAVTDVELANLIISASSICAWSRWTSSAGLTQRKESLDKADEFLAAEKIFLAARNRRPSIANSPRASCALRGTALRSIVMHTNRPTLQMYIFRMQRFVKIAYKIRQEANRTKDLVHPHKFNRQCAQLLTYRKPKHRHKKLLFGKKNCVFCMPFRNFVVNLWRKNNKA